MVLDTVAQKKAVELTLEQLEGLSEVLFNLVGFFEVEVDAVQRFGHSDFRVFDCLVQLRFILY